MKRKEKKRVKLHLMITNKMTLKRLVNIKNNIKLLKTNSGLLDLDPDPTGSKNMLIRPV